MKKGLLNNETNASPHTGIKNNTTHISHVVEVLTGTLAVLLAAVLGSILTAQCTHKFQEELLTEQQKCQQEFVGKMETRRRQYQEYRGFRQSGLNRKRNQ